MAGLSPKEEALKILNKAGADCSAQEILQLSKKLKALKSFNYARRILAIAITFNNVSNDLMLTLYQQLALCTGKDADLSAAVRFDEAIAILKNNFPDLDNTTNQETLGIAGGIMKRKWENDAQVGNLELALHYYSRGYKQGIVSDQGYTAINAAFILDLLVQQATANKVLPSKDTKEWKAEAADIRNKVIADLKQAILEKKQEEDWWVLVTIAEAYFGLGQYEEARPWLKKAMALPGIDDWEKETTTKQLARIAMMHNNGNEQSKALITDVLMEMINNNEEDISILQSAFDGKIGLALSGGGFRASLYHIGVLARLAETDMLRRVEVLSCVSGGSIIGAHYYLELRNLLETKADKTITTKDYIEIVARIETQFLAGVQRNLRTRVVSNLFCNLKMFFSATYTRTNRMGDLYETELFSRVNDKNNKKERWLNHLYIHPMQANGQQNLSFNPKYDNWRRRAKVPVLILNATTLNTGHNWQFTASWMGESPAAIQKIDGNYRLRRMYYKDKPEVEPKYQRKIRLGYAVAASSGVPGMFEPVTLPGYYDGKVVRLVDGGVHDNQGICGLLEQDCEVMLVSDASGQMGSLDKPAGDALGVPLRANDILMERVRNAQFQDMNRRHTAGLLKGLMFIHLKLGLDVESIDWVGCEDPQERDLQVHQEINWLAYDIRKDLQAKLAAIRTDLDSFNDTEAHALMTSGYLMTVSEFSKNVNIPLPENTEAVNWNFLEIKEDLYNADSSEHFIKLLDIGRERVFKIWHISKWLKITGWILLFLMASAVVYGVWYYQHRSILTVGTLGITIGFFILGMFISKLLIRIIRFRETVIKLLTNLGLVIFSFLISWLHLLIFDCWYLKAGSRKKKQVKTNEI